MAESGTECQCLAQTTAAATRATDYLHTHDPPILASSCVVLTAVEDAIQQFAQCMRCAKTDSALLQVIALEQATCIIKGLYGAISCRLPSAEPANRLMTVRVGGYVDQIIPARSLELAMLREHISTLLRVSVLLDASFRPRNETCPIGADGNTYALGVKGLLAVTCGHLAALKAACEKVPLRMALADPGAHQRVGTF